MTRKQYIKQSTLFAVALAFALVAMIPIITSAQGNSGRVNGHEATVDENVQERRDAAQARVEEKRLARGEKSLERRQAACEKRAERINTSIDRIGTRASKHLQVFDSFYEKVQAFYDKGQLTVSNYDELKAAADEAQADAKLEVESLGELDAEIDCSDPEVAVKVSAYRETAVAARDTLKDYRKALVALISSMRAAAAEENSQNGEATNEENEAEETGTETENEAEQEAENEEETSNETENE